MRIVRSGSILLGATLIAAVGAAQEPARDAAERAGGKRDEQICKRFIETGSLVRGYRVCKSKWEWERERENVRQFSVSDTCRDRANGGSLCN